MLAEALIIKVAFVVQSERMHYIHGGRDAPTVPKFSAAVSEIGNFGTIFRPVIVWRSR